MTVTIYTLPSCVQCDSTKRYLTRNLVEFTEVDMSKSKKARDHVMALGYSQAPVVEFGDQHWSGFRLERLDSIVKAMRAAGK